MLYLDLSGPCSLFTWAIGGRGEDPVSLCAGVISNCSVRTVRWAASVWPVGQGK